MASIAVMLVERVEWDTRSTISGAQPQALRVRRVRPATSQSGRIGRLPSRRARGCTRNLIHRNYGARTTSERTRNIMSLSNLPAVVQINHLLH
jgi:hypothetical protein